MELIKCFWVIDDIWLGQSQRRLIQLEECLREHTSFFSVCFGYRKQLLDERKKCFVCQLLDRFRGSYLAACEDLDARWSPVDILSDGCVCISRLLIV